MKKNIVLDMAHGKMHDFVSFSLLRFTLVIKLTNLIIEIPFKFFLVKKKKYMSDLIMSSDTVSDLV